MLAADVAERRPDRPRPESPPARPPSNRRVRRAVGRLRWWAVTAVGLLLAGAGLTSATALASAHHDLSGARSALDAARAAMARHDVAATADSLARAGTALDRADARANRSPLNLLAPVPLAGSPVKALRGGVAAGREAVAAGTILNEAADAFPTSGATSVDGHDLAGVHDAATRSTAALAAADAHLTKARQALEGPAGALLPPVSGPAIRLLRTVDGAKHQLEAAERGLSLLSGLTAPDTDVRLLLLSQDSMELRATGGFIGSFGVFHFSDGTVNLERYDSTGALPRPQPPLEAPIGLAGALARPWDLSNANWWPDFPTSARTAIDMYARQGGGTLDGVVALTDDAMGRMVGAVGPVSLPGYAKPVTEEGFAERVLYEVELKVPHDEPRKKFLSELADEVFHRLFSLPAGKLPGVVQALGKAGSTGGLQMYFSDPARQKELAGSVLEGALPAAGGDFLQLVDSNLTAGKANAQLVRDIRYRVAKGKNGRPVASLDITYANNGAASEVNPYYNGYLRVYVPRGSTLSDPSGGDISSAADGPYAVIVTRVYVEPLGRRSVHLEYVLPESVTKGGYHLTWLRQPGTPADRLTATLGSRSFAADPAERRLDVDADL